MDDDRKKFPRKGGPKPGGPRGKDAPRKGGKFGLAGKSRFEGGKPSEKLGDRTGASKPFAKRRAESQTSGAERPKREFRRDERPRDGDDARPQRSGAQFRKGPRPDGKPYEKREGQGASRPGRFERGDRPHNARERGSETGERRERRFDSGPRDDRKPFVRRPEREAETASERPARRFDRSQGPREGGFERRPKSDGFKRPDAERKPFARAKAVEEAPGERIAKRLARVGIASRRDAEELIAAGRVKVNGKVLGSPAFNVMPDDRIELDGNLIPPIERTRLFLFHKPAGLVTTNRDPEGRKTIFDALPAELPRLMTVGRLDINTEGLLLLTNDGGLARVLELPATGWLRRYRVRVHGKVDTDRLAGLKDGMAIDGVFYGSVEATLDREQGSNAWLTLALREGKNREVKNILGSLGLDVTRLIRVSYGPFQLGELPEGHVQELSGRTLRDQLGERLIEESGANFEADIVKPFTNKPARREHDKPTDEAASQRAPRRPRPLNVGEGGLIKNRRRDDERHREDVLGRLQTKPDRGFKSERGPGPERGPKPERGERPARVGKPAAREQRPVDPPGGRKANVWMAPGARPIGAGRAAAEKAEGGKKAHGAGHHKHSGKPFFEKPGGGKSGFGKPRRHDDERGNGQGDGPRSGGPRPSGPRGGKSDADRRR
ncbi:pseudouridine synthase [Pseudaminobacter sp. NGMCC 1.201702]|uniref:pseudouridine synthase n=1 Tax=Pseudaminobacter sp. NGMCC 1.201702 TaxID=3391825 RepID=UPI0039EED19D